MIPNINCIFDRSKAYIFQVDPNFDHNKNGNLDIVADSLFGSLNGNRCRTIHWLNNEGNLNISTTYLNFNRNTYKSV